MTRTGVVTGRAQTERVQRHTRLYTLRMGRVGRRVAAVLARPFSPRWRWMLPGVALFTLLRLPSFMEPHWYADEASYTAVATSLLHGHVLYLDIWNNKPPLQSW